MNVARNHPPVSYEDESNEDEDEEVHEVAYHVKHKKTFDEQRQIVWTAAPWVARTTQG